MMNLFNFAEMSDDALRAVLLIYSSAIVAFLSAIFVGRTFSEKSYLSHRLKALHDRRDELRTGIKAAKERKNKVNEETIKNIATRLNLIQESQIQKYRELLVSSGNNDKNAVFRVAIQKAVWPFVIGIALFLVFKLSLSSFKHPDWHHLVLIGGMYGGFKLPDILLKNARDKRWHKIRKALPDGLDLLMVCAEAGLTLNTGLDRVAKELKDSYPELSEELTLTAIEMSFLPEKRKALENLQKRVNIQEVRGIISVLVQTEKYGTPIAQALRALSADYRMQRMLAAEQKAARLPAIMTVPMIVFILPTLFAVVISPAILNLAKTMK